MRRILLLAAVAALMPTTLSAKVKAPVPQPSTPTAGETYYLYNAKNYAFLMRGELWQTRLGTSQVGWAFTWEASSDEGYFNLTSIKNGNTVYAHCGDQWSSWYDGNEDSEYARFQIEPVGDTQAFYIHPKNVPTQYAFYRASGWNDRAVQSWTGSGNEDCQWQFISEVDYQEYMKAMDAYASAYGVNMDACLAYYGNMWTLAAQSGEYSFKNGYMCNGTTTKGDGVLHVVPLWNDVHLYDELLNMPAGRYNFGAEATKSGAGWVNTFAASSPGVSNRWKAEPGAAGYLGKANNFGYFDFEYDPAEGSLGVGIRSWSLNDPADNPAKNSWAVDLRKFHLTWNGSGKYTVNVGAAGYATLFLPYAATIPAGITAYTGVVNGEYLTLTALEDGVIPAETAVVLKADAAGDYTFVQTTADAFTGSNDLLGDISKTAQDGSAKYYVLADKEGVGFYTLNETSAVPGFKAYLKLAAGTSAKAFSFASEGTTAIAGVGETAGKKDSKVYNLAGQRLQKMQKGINVVDGKKVMY